MKLRDFYKEAIRQGLANDPRSRKEIDDDMKRSRKAYRNLGSAERRCFDTERLRHPYADTRILHGDPGHNVKTVLVGIDIETPELLLADRMRERGLTVDLALAHHPEGHALSSLSEVMYLQKDLLVNLGIKRVVVDAMLDERIQEVERSLSAVNHTRSVDAARLLDIPYMCVHTPADNHVVTYLTTLLDKRRPKKIKDVLRILRDIPEYTMGMRRSTGPVLIAGKESNDAEKIFVDMTGGTEGAKAVFARLSQAGVGTIIGMHLSEAHYKNAKAEHINVIIAGHIASDTLGINLLLDSIEKKERLNIVGCSGFERVRRI
ncbi:MAG: NGG1p interacting factor NIF3 [Candidatus Omnitrophica bacterium]|nr:NGG1p interacting factor NIF3 [Candidatus Omnitrophota bacterium]